MALPAPPNTTCEIYRNSNAPPAAPDVALTAIHFIGDFHKGVEQGESIAAAIRYSHVLLIDVAIDVRDGYERGSIVALKQDHVWVPDRNGTKFDVIFVERPLRDAPHDHKRVFLQRQNPTWPTNEV